MKLKVVESSSKGNGYILEGKNSALLLECGVHFNKVSKLMNFQVKNIDGCLLTHEHGDHCKYAQKYTERGIKIFGSKGTLDKLKFDSIKLEPLEKRKEYQIGEFRVIPFDVRHPAEEPFGYFINHPECGNILFALDTYYIPYTFKNMDFIFIEANYDQVMIDENVEEGNLHPLVRNRTMRGHMEIETLLDMLKENDLTDVKKIVLLHLSKMNSNKEMFIEQVKMVTGIPTYAAQRDLIVEINKNL